MRRFLIVLGLVLTLLAGCARAEPTAEAAGGAARSFMESLAAGSFEGVGALTAEGPPPHGCGDRRRRLAGPPCRFEGVGEAREIEPGVMQVPLVGVTVRDPGRSVRWPQSRLTLRREDERWAVAWAEPLFEPAETAYHNTLYQEQLDLARDIVAIDPYHYRGHLELHYAYRGLGRFRQAEHAVEHRLGRASVARESRRDGRPGPVQAGAGRAG